MCTWLALCLSHLSHSCLCAICTETQPLTFSGMYDSFVQMLDEVYNVKNRVDVLILGDFDIDMLKPHPCWDSALALFGLAQLITSPTRTTPRSTSLTDHIYTNNPCAVVTNVSDLSISDHNPISCIRSIKLPKPEPKGHTNVSLDPLNILTKMHSLLISSARRLTISINTRTLTRL